MVEWLNVKYSKKMLAAAAKQFDAQGSIRLFNFLSEQALAQFNSLSWKHDFEPLKNSFHWAKLPSFVFSSNFFEVLSAICGGNVSSKSLICASFKKGDFSVLLDSLPPMEGIVLLLDINSLKEEWGGYSVFMRGNEEVLRVVPQQNTLTLIKSEDLREFVKYVNNHAKNDRICIAGVLKLND